MDDLLPSLPPESASETSELRERFRKLYESTPAMLHSIDTSGKLLTVSDAWLSKMGYTRDEVIGRPSIDFLTPASRDYARNVVLPVFFQSGRCDAVPYQFVRKDGSVMDVQLSAIFDRDDQRSLAAIEDVTEQSAAKAALEDQQQRLTIATESNQIGIWEWRLSDNRFIGNDILLDIFGLERGHPIPFDWTTSVHADDAALVREKMRDAIALDSPFEMDFRIVWPDSSVHYLHVRATVFRDANGQALRVLGATQDITARKIAEQALAERSELLQVTLQSIGDAVITTDARGNVQWLNPVAERMTGWSSELAYEQSVTRVFSIVHEQHRTPLDNPVTRSLKSGHATKGANHALLIALDGREFGVEDSAAPIRDAQGNVLGAVLIFRDVTEQRRFHSEMNYRAKHDGLTGLLNRTEFEVQLDRLMHEMRNSNGKHALMFIDLDQFKLINDACGHAMGDQLLRQVSKLLQGCIRNRDVLARLGGDEFAVVLERCPLAQAQKVAQKICDRMDEFRFMHDERSFRVGSSIGLVPFDERWHNTAALLQAADASCYAAKDAGRNRVHTWADTDRAIQTRHGEMQWASRLEQALDENRFELYGQRIHPVNPAAGGIHIEMLLRLRDIDGALIAPGAFLPAAERFYLISRIDRWVIRAVFNWMSLAHEQLDHIDAIAINVSGQSIGDRAFHRHIMERISTATFDVRKLCFEITETAAITNLGDASAFIDGVRKLGVRIALDDFGAGASSFGYLKMLAVDYLKIDGQFIRDLIEDPLDTAAVRCFRDVAKVIGVKTIAEFVERDDTLAALREIGIDFAQGYAIHKPEPLHRLKLSADIIGLLP